MNINPANLIAIQNVKYEVSFLGKLLWFSLPELKVSRPELEVCFANNYIEDQFLPNPICSSDAFRRATKLGERKRVNIDDTHSLNLLVRDVSSDKNIVTRQIVREVVDTANKRLEYLPIMTLVHEKDSIRFDHYDLVSNFYPIELEALAQVKQAFDEFKEKYSTQNVRSMIMGILDSCSPVSVRPSGGVYFVPEKYSCRIENLKNLVLELSQYCVNSEEKTDFKMVPVVDVSDQRDMINESLELQVKNESYYLINEIAEILKSGRKVNQKTAVNFVEKVKALKAKIKEYEVLLETEINTVQGTMDLAMDAAKKLFNNVEAA